MGGWPEYEERIILYVKLKYIELKNLNPEHELLRLAGLDGDNFSLRKEYQYELVDRFSGGKNILDAYGVALEKAIKLYRT